MWVWNCKYQICFILILGTWSNHWEQANHEVSPTGCSPIWAWDFISNSTLLCSVLNAMQFLSSQPWLHSEFFFFPLATKENTQNHLMTTVCLHVCFAAVPRLITQVCKILGETSLEMLLWNCWNSINGSSAFWLNHLAQSFLWLKYIKVS